MVLIVVFCLFIIAVVASQWAEETAGRDADMQDNNKFDDEGLGIVHDPDLSTLLDVQITKPIKNSINTNYKNENHSKQNKKSENYSKQNKRAKGITLSIPNSYMQIKNDTIARAVLQEAKLIYIKIKRYFSGKSKNLIREFVYEQLNIMTHADSDACNDFLAKTSIQKERYYKPIWDENGNLAYDTKAGDILLKESTRASQRLVAKHPQVNQQLCTMTMQIFVTANFVIYIEKIENEKGLAKHDVSLLESLYHLPSQFSSDNKSVEESKHNSSSYSDKIPQSDELSLINFIRSQDSINSFNLDAARFVIAHAMDLFDIIYAKYFYGKSITPGIHFICKNIMDFKEIGELSWGPLYYAMASFRNIQIINGALVKGSGLQWVEDIVEDANNSLTMSGLGRAKEIADIYCDGKIETAIFIMPTILAIVLANLILEVVRYDKNTPDFSATALSPYSFAPIKNNKIYRNLVDGIRRRRVTAV